MRQATLESFYANSDLGLRGRKLIGEDGWQQNGDAFTRMLYVQRRGGPTQSLLLTVRFTGDRITSADLEGQRLDPEPLNPIKELV